MERFEPVLCQCGFRLLCCASGVAFVIIAGALLIFR
jgi:hypothetical protein